MRRSALTVSLAATLCLVVPARGDDPSSAARSPTASVLLDRVVVRWHAPEAGGIGSPRFVFERELAFEARIEALASPDMGIGPYSERHIRAALDRHIAEVLLASIPITPPPAPKEVARRAEVARCALEQRTRGRARLIAAAAAEGIGSDELDALLRRQARASFYLDRVVGSILEPSEFELRSVHRSGATPFKDQEYDDVSSALRCWYVGQRLAQALETYYQNARSRVTISIVRTP